MARYSCLCELLSGKSNLIGVEIGVAAGGNALDLLQRLDIKNLFLIDPYVNYEDKTQGEGLVGGNIELTRKEAEINMKDKKVSWIRRMSWDAVSQFNDKSLDFVYIDGAHQYSSVSRDIKDWLPKIKKGGIIAGHDIDHIVDVERAVKEILPNYKSYSCDWWSKL